MTKFANYGTINVEAQSCELTPLQKYIKKIKSSQKKKLNQQNSASLPKILGSFDKLKNNLSFENLGNFLNTLPKLPKSDYVAPPKVKPAREKSWGENIWDFGAGIGQNASDLWSGF